MKRRGVAQIDSVVMSGGTYRVHGLTVASELPLPVLAPFVDRLVDVEVRVGTMPWSLPRLAAGPIRYEAHRTQFRLAVDGVATYWVTGGNRIVVDPESGCDADHLRLFLLGSAFGALLHQRGALPLHASAIQVKDTCVAVAGPKGIGKSTLAAAFSKIGYPIITDDVLAVRVANDGPPTCETGYPQVKLWSDSLRRLGVGTRGLRRFRGSRPKYALPVTLAAPERPLRLTGLYILGVCDIGNLSVEPLQGGAKLISLLDNTYRSEFLRGMQRQPEHFRQCVRLAECLRIRQVRRPNGRFLLQRLARMIERDWSDGLC